MLVLMLGCSDAIGVKSRGRERRQQLRSGPRRLRVRLNFAQQ